MALIGATLDYTDRDFASLNARIRSLIVSIYPDWTDDKMANFANLLMEAPAFVGDILAFYQNNQAREAFLTTCRQRKNALSHCKRLNYTPSTPVAATADLTFTLAAPVQAGATVTFNPPVPSGGSSPSNQVTASTEDADNPQAFELLSQLVLAAGQTSGTASVSNSLIRQDVFISSSRPSQRYILSGSPYLDGSAVVTDDVGSYEIAGSLLQAGPLDRLFTVLVDENDAATIVFGDGTLGTIPVGTITITYRIGGGAAGNVPAGAITKIPGTFVDSLGGSVTVTVTNADRASGGLERQSIASIREQAPLSVTTNGRCISRTDFEFYACQGGTGIARALMLTRNEDPGGTSQPNVGNLYLVPANLGFPTIAQINAVATLVTQTHPCDLTFNPVPQSCIYLDVGLTAKIYLTRAAAATAAVKAAVVARIVAAVTQWFALTNADGTSNSNVNFGWYLQDDSAAGADAPEISLSIISALIQGVQGVREIGDQAADLMLRACRVRSTNDSYPDAAGSAPAQVVQASSHQDVPISVRDFPRLKTYTWGSAIPDIVLMDGDTNVQLHPPVA